MPDRVRKIKLIDLHSFVDCLVTLTLNNQVIRLLSDLGNSDDTFRALQNESFDHWDIPEEQQSLGIEIAIRRKQSYLS